MADEFLGVKEGKMELSEKKTFGELLKAFRTRSSKYPILNQKGLADKIGVSEETISAWERGKVRRPSEREIVIRVRNALHLSDLDTNNLLFTAQYPLLSSSERQEKPKVTGVVDQERLLAVLPALPSHWYVPYQRNRYFTGRETLLQQIHSTLRSMKTVAVTHPQAITGLGGIGKTQVALEYVYQYHSDYQTVLWVRADTRETILADYMNIAELLNLPEKNEREQTLIVAAVKRWLHQHEGWFLILDNADNLDVVHEFLPTLDRGHILLTTRLSSLGTLASPMEIEVMEPREGTLFILRRAGLLAPHASLQDATETDRTQAAQIVEIMGGLPLALDQAGAYIQETRCSLSDYFKLYQTRHTDLLKRKSRFPSNYHFTVATTWSLPFQHIEQDNPVAAEMLKLCAFLHPDAIPEDIFIEGGDDLGSALKAVTDDSLMRDEAIEALRRYSLVQRNPETRTLTIHRLVQTVLRNAMNMTTQRQLAEQTIRVINHMFPETEAVLINQALFTTCEQYLPHAQVCLDLIKQYAFTFPEAPLLLKKVGAYVFSMQPAQAKPYYLQMLAIQEQVLGSEHPKTLSSLHSLADIYFMQGKYTKGLLLHQKILRIREKVQGSEHIDTIVSLHEIAMFYFKQGKYSEAEPLYQRYLSIIEKVKGPQDVSISNILNNIVKLYYEQGRYVEAELLCQQALSSAEKLLGAEHPRVATSLHNMAKLYHTQGKYSEAETLYQRSLAIREKRVNPFLAETCDGLALLYFEQGRYTEAELFLQRALTFRENVLGLEHPDIADSLNNLGKLYSKQGKYTEAESLLQRALTLREKTLGTEHPLIAMNLNSLGELYYKQARYIEVEPLLQRSLAINERILGPEHREVAINFINLGNLFFQQGKYAEAEPLYQQAISIFKKALGPQHPFVAVGLNNLGTIYIYQNKYTEAKLFLQQAINIREKALGPEHADLAESLNSLGELYCKQGKYVEAEPLYQRALTIREKALGLEHADTIATKEQHAALREHIPLGVQLPRNLNPL